MFSGRFVIHAIRWTLLGLVGLVVLPAVAAGQSATLSWDPNPEPNISGYTVGYGTRSGQYTQTQYAGLRTSWSLTGLTAGVRYYFAVRANNSDGLSSNWSAASPGTAPRDRDRVTLSAYGG